ncbi:unnamed protein product [Larinioides sclopetarius]|uniref:Uncharacterized protein n=1 Tax=Larinioides sclopetarius TaxID=280406 RepID=A0AAV2ABR6_9ARAC
MRCVFVFVLVSFIVVVRGSPECTKYEFPCDDGECIDAALWCDSHEDCLDKSDEKYCKKAGMFGGKDPNKCSSKYFRCSNGPCIPISGRCDGYENCEDSSDEKNCAQEISPKNEGPSSYKPVTSRMETRTIPATSTRATIHQTTVKLDSHAMNISDSTEAMQHTIEMVYSDFRPSDYSRQREKARNWLLSQRRHDFGWGAETPRAITALYLADVQQPTRKNESDLLMVKQLEVQLSLDMARNGTKEMKLADLALYINALLASCKDPKNFYGENLVRTLRNGVDAAQRGAKFVNPSVYLTLCINNVTTYEDTRKFHDLFLSSNAAIGRTDIQALALLTITCIFQSTNLLTALAYDGLRKLFLQRMNSSGLPGNVYEASLLAQALQALKVTRPGLLEFILKQQQEDGSFGGILATYLALPALAGRSFLQMSDHCSQEYKTDLVPIEVLKNLNRRRIHVRYSLNYGYPPEMTETIEMQVAEGINFLDVMRLAQEINPKFRFMLDGKRDVPVVYSIGGIPNDAEKGTFWTLYLTSKNKDAGRLVPYSGNIKQLMPISGDEFIFWMRSL